MRQSMVFLAILSCASAAAQTPPLRLAGNWQTPGPIQQPTGPWQKAGDIQVPKGIEAVKATTAQCMTTISIVADALFDFNKSTLQPASAGVLQQVVDLLAKDKTLKVEVQGHTDNVGGEAYNQTLSEARARAVADWLTKQGVAAARLSALGYGRTKPVADNNNDEGRAKNRRVEIADPACAPAKP